MPLTVLSLIAITVCGTAAFARTRNARWAYVVLYAVADVMQIGWSGLYWQLVPVFCAQVVALFFLFRASQQRPFASAVVILFALVTAAALWVFPMFALPRPTGSYAVGTTGPLHWADTSRNLQGDAAGGSRRELEVQIWYPATTDRYDKKARYARFRELSPVRSYEAAIQTNSALDAPLLDKGGPFPVLLFGHRWGGSRTQDTFLAEELASHGYVVVAVDHPLNAARVEMADGSVVLSDRAGALGNLEAAGAPAIEAIWGKELAIWTADNRFVLDRLLANNDGWFAGRLDASRIGAFGHSFGGAASTALLGADPRVKCAINLDGWTFQGLDKRTTEPILEVYEGVSEVRKPEVGVVGQLDHADNAAVDASLARYGGVRAYVVGTQHLDFTDQTLLSPFQRLTSTGPIKGERIRTITRGLVLGFFDEQLKGMVGAMPGYPEVHVQRFPATAR